VAVTAAKQEAVRDVLVAHASLEPQAHVDVPLRAAGEVVALLVEANDQVQKGQVLLRLDDTRAKLAVEEAELALSRSKTSLVRQDGLAKRGLATAEELDLAREAVAQAELSLRRTRLDLADTELRSPLSGVVTERLVDLGDTLQTGTAAFRVADRDPLLLQARVPEVPAERLAVGQVARIHLEGRAEAIEGKVIRVAPVVDTESGTVVTTVEVARSEGVRIGRFASVEIIVAERADAVTIPQDALSLRGDEDRVLVCTPAGDGKGTVAQRTVRTGVRQGANIEVVEGIEAGELIVVAAPDDLRDGAKVRLVQRGGAAPAPQPEAPASRPAAGPGGGRR
jgi:membrane fusion protein (multidrug efflux system)